MRLLSGEVFTVTFFKCICFLSKCFTNIPFELFELRLTLLSVEKLLRNVYFGKKKRLLFFLRLNVQY